MDYKNLLHLRRKRLDKVAAAFDLLSDPDIKAQLENDPEMRQAFINAIRGGDEIRANIVDKLRDVKVGLVTLAGPALPPEGSQLRAILDGANHMPGPFTIKVLVEAMQKSGYRFEARDPQIAANSALKDLHARGLVTLVKQGRGRMASVFSSKKEDKTEGLPFTAAPSELLKVSGS